jgi:TetR/AcrR family transcriptional regulator, cholesterol catabolism regulator
MDQIAHDLGASKKSLYKWFANKDQLVEEVLETYLATLNAACTAGPENAVAGFCHTFDQVVKKLLAFDPAFYFDMQKYHHRAYASWVAYRENQIVTLFKQNLEAGIKSGLYRPEFNPDILARLFVGQLQNIFNGEIFPAEKFDRQEIYEQNLQHFLLGLVSRENLNRLAG